MDRRSLLLAGLTAPLAATAVSADGHNANSTAFVLVHGSWHGAWCWGLVEPHLRNAGHMTLPIDLPGHGLNARNPAAFLSRPLDPAAFASEPWAAAGIGVDAYADAVLSAAAQARAAGAKRVVAVGHSMGGVPITFAAAKDPAAIDALVYLTAVVPTPGKPGGYYISLKEQTEQSKLGPLVMADPAQVGSLRIDPRSTDATYLAAAKDALAADVPDDLLAQVMHMLTPDAPVAFYGDVAEFPAAYAGIRRTYIKCTQDHTLVPSTADATVADLNAAWPDNPCQMLELATSHEAMFSKPKEVADLLMQGA